MYGFICVFVLATVLQTINSQEFPPYVPEHCKIPPSGVKTSPHDCCKVPEFFKEADFEECGFQKLEDNQKPPRNRGPHDCNKSRCLMKKFNLLKDDDNVDFEAAAAFIDKWGETNPDFKPALDSIKKRCASGKLPGPPQVCEADKLIFCIGVTTFENCPKWEDTDDCHKIKDHMDECKQYFPNHQQ